MSFAAELKAQADRATRVGKYARNRAIANGLDPIEAEKKGRERAYDGDSIERIVSAISGEYRGKTFDAAAVGCGAECRRLGAQSRGMEGKARSLTERSAGG